MQVELLLNPNAQNYGDFVADLENELRGLKGLRYKQVEAPAPPKTLNVEHDIVKLIFEQGPNALKLVISVLQLAQVVATRRGKANEGAKRSEPTEPTAVLKVDDRTLGFPASDRAQRALVEAVRTGKTRKAKGKKKNQKKPKTPNRKKSRSQ